MAGQWQCFPASGGSRVLKGAWEDGSVPFYDRNSQIRL